MLLRTMLESDIDNVYDIESSVNLFPWSIQHFLTSLRNTDVCTSATDNNQLIAYTVFSKVLNEATLLNMAVSPDYQRKGYGKKLLELCLQDLYNQGIDCCYLEVRKSNARAISLYKLMGFTQIGIRKNYYPAVNEREDARIMSVHLPINSEGS